MLLYCFAHSINHSSTLGGNNTYMLKKNLQCFLSRCCVDLDCPGWGTAGALLPIRPSISQAASRAHRAPVHFLARCWIPLCVPCARCTCRAPSAHLCCPAGLGFPAQLSCRAEPRWAGTPLLGEATFPTESSISMGEPWEAICSLNDPNAHWVYWRKKPFPGD